MRTSPMPMILLAVFIAGLFFYSYTEGMAQPATPPMAEPTNKDKKNTPVPSSGSMNAATTAAPAAPSTLPDFRKPA